ncbi:MAG: tetratricopeptide repeat protein, partial [Aridibacter famidurans]|nr:tetratricopeptide repeat protein [Aridibacter famidurans]
YSLGVILYEMLTGSRPFKSKEDDIKAIYDAVEGEVPPLPSEAARTGTVTFSSEEEEDRRSTEHGTKRIASETGASRRNRTEPDSSPLKWQLLRGDLDNIILKALKKEPERRYSSAERFGDDIRRFLDGLPVSARADTLGYRAGKFVRRNYFAVGAAFLVLLAISVGFGTTLWQARQTRIEAERATAEAEKTRKALDFVGNILNFANPFWNSPNPERRLQATVVEAMVLAVQNVEKELADEPEVQAEILYILGKAYLGKGDYKTSEQLLKRSIERYDSVRGPGNLRSMQIRGNLGDHQYLQGKYEDAEKNYRASIDHLRSRIGEDDETKLFLAGALTGLGNVYGLSGKFRDSAALNNEALDIAETFRGDERKMVPILLSNLGFAHTSLGELDDAARYFELALAEVRAQGAKGSADEAMILAELGRVALSRGDHSRAEELARSSHEIYAKALGDRNFYTLGAANLIGRILVAKGELEGAEAHLNDTFRLVRDVYPDGNLVVAVTTSLLGEVDTRKGRLKEGEAKHREVLEYVSGLFKEPNHQVATAKARLGMNLAAQYRFEEAHELVRSAYDVLSKTRGEGHPETVRVKKELEKLGSKR